MNYYKKGPSIKDDYIVIVKFFTPETDRCEICGAPAIGTIKSKRVCSKRCAKEVVYTELDKFMDDKYEER